ncbi:hypothetical protein [uncultured Brevundimonas sp.]|uniref:SEL1-like repeat protein n=1 Tax=uncultured Brevundimonas sp. TaxID=213418 RepID=UPI002610C879|nr:hypothetical protein [uncultured Brevundimonas sp.]
MSATAPWSVKGIDPRAREIAKDLARRSGMTLGEWLNSVIMDEPEDDGTRRMLLSDGLDRRSQRRRSEDETETNFTLNALIAELGERLEATERRSASAIQGIDQAVSTLMRRMESDREQDSQRERRLDDIGRELREGHQRLRALESRDGSAGVSDLGQRLDQAQNATRLALQGMERSFAALEQRLGQVEARPAGAEGALTQLADSLREQIEANRQELLGKLNGVADSARLARVEQVVAQLGAQTKAAEQRAARAVEAMGQEVMRIARNMHTRMQAVEEAAAASRAEASVDQRLAELGRVLDEKLDREIARQSETIESRLTRHEDQHALALERLGNEITRISDRLSERIAQTERRSTQAIDDISRRLNESAERLERRSDDTTSDLAERLRQSEERTRKLLDEAREQRARREASASFNAPRLTAEVPPSDTFDSVPEFIPESPAASLFGSTQDSPPAQTILDDWRAVVASRAEPAAPEAQATPGWADTVAAELAVDPFPSADTLRPFGSLEDDLDAAVSEISAPVAEADPYPAIFEGSDAPEDVFGDIHAVQPQEPQPELIEQFAAAPQEDAGAFDFGEFLAAEEKAAEEEAPEEVPVAASDEDLYADTDQAVEAAQDVFDTALDDFSLTPQPTTRDVIDSARAAIAEEAVEEAPLKTFGLKLRKKGGTSALQQKLNRKAERDSSTFGQALKVSALAMLVVGGGGYGTLKLMRGQDLSTPMGKEPVEAGAPMAALALDATPTDAVPSREVAETEGKAIFERAVALIDNGDPSGIEPLTRSAELGYVPAQMRLAALYTDGGLGVGVDLVEAREWVRRAAEAGDARAMQHYATQLYDGVGGARDEAAAVHWMRRSAEAGRVDSQYNLAHLYEKGVKGVPADRVQAFTWYMIAARRGDQQALESVQRLTTSLTAEERRQARDMADDFNVQPLA